MISRRREQLGAPLRYSQGNSGNFKTPPMANRLSLIENSREGPAAGACSDDRTREDVGRIVVETSYHENGDPNAIYRTYSMRTAAVTINPTTTSTPPPPKRTQEITTTFGATTVKKKGTLLSCFPQSKKNIFYFKSPKKENVVPSDYLSGTAPLAAGPHRLKKLTSVDSANTISNSSLQEVDEEEFNSSDLVKYMDEINQGIKC